MKSMSRRSRYGKHEAGDFVVDEAAVAAIVAVVGVDVIFVVEILLSA